MDDICLKGLKNEGNNMCFVNVICQSLWNLFYVKNYLFNNSMHSHSEPPMYESNHKIQEMINKLTENTVDNLIEKNTDELISIKENDLQKNCLQCVLSKFFSNYFSSNMKFLDASEIRFFLINLNNSIQKFSKNGMSCSTETLEEMILYFHRSYLYFNYIKYKGILGQKIQDFIDTITCNDKCLTHSIFTTEYQEIIYCENCPKKEILKSNKESISINYVYFSDLEQKKSKNLKGFIKTNYKLVSKLNLVKCVKCEDKNQSCLKIKRCLIRPSKVIVISLVASLNVNIELVYDKLDKKIFLSDLFDEMDIEFYKKMLILKGFVCFRKKHYIYAGYVNKSWVLLNDENVLFFTVWDKLKETLVKNLWFPTLLFYEDIDYEDDFNTTSKPKKPESNEKKDNEDSLNTMQTVNIDQEKDNFDNKDGKRKVNQKGRKSVDGFKKEFQKEECIRCKFF